MEPTKDLATLLQEAEQLRRRWFRQLKALEGDEHWPEGWQRLQHLRSISQRIAIAMEKEEEEALDELVTALRIALKEAEGF
jgi:hypothetical protein